MHAKHIIFYQIKHVIVFNVNFDQFNEFGVCALNKACHQIRNPAR